MSRVAVMMSGGVDSSLAAALLLEQGHDVIGITLKLIHQTVTHGYGGCCAYSDTVDARRVAQDLGIDHYMLNIADDFKERVIEPFEKTYRAGRTPNPCVECNRAIKFDLIHKKARQLGMDQVATGHYARIEKDNDGFHLMRGPDRVKDQTYFLYTMGRDSLEETLFPVGHLEKTETRKLAEKYKIQVANKSDSTGICFVQGGDYRGRFQEESSPVKGEIVDSEGQVLAHHQGIEGFTIGQRKGIGLSGGPYYVLDIIPAEQKVVIGSREQGYHYRLQASNVVWLEPVEIGMQIQTKIRSRCEPEPAILENVSEDAFSLRFDSPAWSITPGQSAVLYDGEKVLGGGVIDSSEKL